MALKKPFFPVNLEKFLRVALPKKRPEDRMKICREWVSCSLWARHRRPPTAEEVNADWELFCKKPFNDQMELDLCVSHLRAFAPKLSAENRKKRAQAAAAKRWSKENRENHAKIIKNFLT